MDEKDKKIEELEAQLKKIEDEKKKEEKNKYIFDKLGSLMFLIAWNCAYLWIIFTLNDVLTSWIDAGAGTLYEQGFVLFAWIVIVFYAIYRAVCGFIELFQPEIVLAAKWIEKWIDETRKARAMYLEKKKQE